MLQRLNYYSRYNRIRSPKKINTLYHLIEDLNLQAIVTDDLIQRVSCLRDAHQDKQLKIKQYQKLEQNVDNRGRNQRKEHGGDGWYRKRVLDNGEQKRRVASCEKEMKVVITEQLLQDKYVQELNRKQKTKTDRLKGNQIKKQNQQLIRPKLQEKQRSTKSGNKSNYEPDFAETKSVIEYEQHKQNSNFSPFADAHPPSNTPLNNQVIQKQSNFSQYQQPNQIQTVGNESQIIQIQTNKRDNGKQQLFKNSNFDGSEELAELHEVDIRKSSCVKIVDPDQSDIKGQDFGCRSEKLYRMHGSDFEMEGTDREDEIFINQHSDNISKPLSQIPVTSQSYQQYAQSSDKQRLATKAQKQAVYLPYKKTLTASPDSNNQQNEYEGIQQHYQYDEEQYMQNYSKQNNQGQLSHHQGPEQFNHDEMDNSVSVDGHNSMERQVVIKRIPFKGLSQGRWPISTTQKSIQATAQVQLSSIPETLQQKQSICIQKQRKPFKKMIMQRKLNPRMVTSTIVNDNDKPVKKVNFKKMIKKESVENKKNSNMQLTPQKKKHMFVKPVEEKKNLLKAFFDLN